MDTSSTTDRLSAGLALAADLNLRFPGMVRSVSVSAGRVDLHVSEIVDGRSIAADLNLTETSRFPDADPNRAFWTHRGEMDGLLLVVFEHHRPATYAVNGQLTTMRGVTS